MKLLKHQQAFLNKNPNKALLCWEGGTGKTVGACVWLKQGRDDNALVICPKKIVQKWTTTLKDWGTKATVVSKNDFKKMQHKHWSAIVVDEADEFASPLYIAKLRSDLSTKLFEQLDNYPSIPVLLLTATPIRSTPYNLHTLLTFMGYDIPHRHWQDAFFELKKMPYMQRPAYFPKADWRPRMRPILEKYADIVLLRDCVELPKVETELITSTGKKFIKTPDSKPFFDEHRHEQLEKAKDILEIGKKFRKILVVAYYREQIEQLEKELGKDKEIFSVHGGTKNQEAVIKKAQESDDCYFIVQASLGAGFDADQFSCVVFASMSYSVRDHAQMKFRVRRIHNLHYVKYYYLLAGRCDKAILKNIEAGKDFLPNEWKDYQ